MNITLPAVDSADLAEAIIRELGLVPLPEEGGLFAETYRSGGVIPGGAILERQTGPRRCCTAIYYLITPERFSALHRVASTEIFHFYLGDPVDMLQLHPDGTGQTVTIGTDLWSGQRPQVVVSPGFEYEDYEHGRRAELVAAYPAQAEQIARLTPVD